MDLRQKGVLRAESGIIEKQGIYFHNASSFAQRYLYYGLWGAEYVCAEPYQVRRSDFNAFLLFYILEGSMQVTYRDRSFAAKVGDVVLLDCHYPHSYAAVEKIRFRWFHFQGSSSAAYCKELWQSSGAHFPDSSALAEDFRHILQLFQLGQEADDLISVGIHRILAQLHSGLDSDGRPEQHLSPQIDRAKQWIEQHYSEPVTVEEAAEIAELSRYHFSRRFQHEVGSTPYAYLLELRLSYAKQQLAETENSVEEIAFDCSFCSASNFIRAFRKNTGMTPHQFRKMTY
ncbi:MAG: AraC family transcriptional regulator [Lachnospiraceae bacterium]|nr:AraC family transcriptional regulator [Lachnospiraceae bacterium]